ncbi:hypothetical protein [Streptomyces sp. NPDC059063]|uniref:hypothetical protein n=1 Tax=unclassified Streptomyces TaxID=2593676 RepID=UPI00367AA20A
MTGQRAGTPADDDTALTVRGLLAAAGLPAGEREIAGLAAAYTARRTAVDGLFAVTAARHARPVLSRDVGVRPGADEEGPA